MTDYTNSYYLPKHYQAADPSSYYVGPMWINNNQYWSNGTGLVPMNNQIGADCSQSQICVLGAATPYPVARIPVPKGTINSAGMLRVHVNVDFTGNAAARQYYVDIVDKGQTRSGTGVTLLGQGFPASTVGKEELLLTVGVSPDIKTITLATQNLPTSGTYLGESTAVMGTTTTDFTVDKDILLTIGVGSGDIGACRYFTVEFEPATATSNSSNQVMTFGDSLTSGTGVGAFNQWWQNVMSSNLLGRPVVNLGIGGQTSAQIANRVVTAANSCTNKTVVLWMGRNDVGGASYSANVMAGLAKSIAAINTNQYIILSNTPAFSTENIGTGNRTAIIALNALINATYPGHYCDILTALATNAGEIPAASYTGTPTAGEVHFSAAGYAIVATTVGNFITSKGW